MNILKYNDSNEEVLLLQRALNELTGKNLTADGNFGKLTEEALRYYQVRNQLDVTGVYGEKDFAKIDPLITRKYIREKDIELRANVARLPVNIIKALRKVEAKSAGFLPNGKVVILFERHKFYQYLSLNKGKSFADTIVRSNPSICNPVRGGYLGNEKEYPRITKAATIDKDAALMSASYGLFQIMGFNYKLAGYSNVSDYVQAMETSETLQLDAVLSFIKKNKNLKTAVENSDFKNIALYYNGPANATNDYIGKLRNAAK